jgi:hypothetical protein
VKPSGFGSRFGYARWLYHLRAGAAPTHAEIAREVNRTGPAVSAWGDADEAPVDYRVHAPLAEFLEVDEAWLVKNVGEPPRPELWQAWRAARAIKQPPEALRVSARAPTSKTNAKKGRSA